MLQNKPLIHFGENIWVIEGSIVKDMGLSFSTRMIVVKLSDGSLWVCDPVQIPDSTLEEVERLGKIEYLLASTQRHIWRLRSWHEKYPKSQLWTCGNIPRKLRGLPFTGVLNDTPIWVDDFNQIIFKGNKLLSEAVFFHKASNTLIMGDIIQNNEKIPGRPFTNFMFRLSGAAYPNGGVGLDLKLTFSECL